MHKRSARELCRLRQVTEGGTKGEGETETKTETGTEAMASPRPQNVGILAMDVYFPASCITQVRMPSHMVGVGIGGSAWRVCDDLAFWVLCFVCVFFFFFPPHFLLWGREVYAGHR